MQSNCALDEIQVKVIYSYAILVAVMSEYRVKRFIRKTLTGTLANSADPDLQRLIRVCTVCLYYREFRVKGNSV